jgi:UPF0716 protein FxsA
MLRIIGVLLLIPLLEMLLLVVLSRFVSWVVIVLLVVLTALIGMLLVRAEGRHTLSKIQQKTARGELPADELLDGALLLVAGAFLVTPGLLTDAIGFLLVLPPTRYPIRIAVKKWVVVPYADAKSRGFVTGNVYIDGFPGQGEAGMQGGPGQGGGSDPRAGGGEAYDLDDEDYDVDRGNE